MASVAARTKARITPSLLTWARQTAGFQPPEAAAKLKIDGKVLAAWEDPNDQSLPSIPQLRKLAALYKRPLAVFYLPKPPQGFLVVRDLRRLPQRRRRYSPDLLFEMRRANQRRELTLDLLRDLEEKPPAFSIKASLDEDPEDVGARARSALKVTMQDQKAWRDHDGRGAFNGWRYRLEDLGVLTFQATDVDSEEASGFAIAADELPVIVINRKDAVPRRTFSLLHEFIHLMLRMSGVSELDFEDDGGPPEEQRIEIFCNRAAAAALIPRDELLADDRVTGKPLGHAGWSDEEIADIARDFGVSREAILRRLLQFNRTTPEFYRRKRAQYLAELAAARARQREQAKGREIKRNMPQETISNIGRPLVHLVLSNYQQNLITLSDVSGFLGLKTKHIPRLEILAGRR
jgi:Zn-dependent peptidase ImmA (M78 family)